MTDDRFYERAGPFTLAEIAAPHRRRAGKGRAGPELRDVAALESAEAGDISLFSDAKYANAFAVTKASVVITSDKLATLPHGVTLLVVPNPRLAFAQVGHIFYPPAKLQPGVRRARAGASHRQHRRRHRDRPRRRDRRRRGDRHQLS